MQYKTIILELLQQRPQLHEQLRRSDILLETMNEQAQRLRTRHLEWSAMLVEVMPESETSQITRTAFELALCEWEAGLTKESLPESFDPLTLDAAMAFIRRSSQPATPEERQTLARFAGFGPVALSIFPDPTTGQYKWPAPRFLIHMV